MPGLPPDTRVVADRVNPRRFHAMALFDDNFLTVLRNGMVEYAESLEGVDIQVEDAQDDVLATFAVGEAVDVVVVRHDLTDVEDRRVRFPLSFPRTATVTSVTSRFAPGGFAIVNPGAAWPNKRWPPVYFAEVSRELAKRHGLRSLVLWGPGEESIAHAVAAAYIGRAPVSSRVQALEFAEQ